MNKIQAILFDFGGTLDNDGVDWFTRLYHGIADACPAIEWDTFCQWARWAADHIATLDDTPTLSMAQTAHRICRHVYHQWEINRDGCPHDWDPAQIADGFMQQASEYLVRNEQVLAALHNRYRLGCISNNWGNTAGWCCDCRFDQYFETMIDSTRVGVTKPDPAIFHAALDDLKLPPNACVYVGDQYNSDMIGARDVGMTPIWIVPDTSQTDPADWLPTHRINRLTDLLTIEL